jgi:hypothetical protein
VNARHTVNQLRDYLELKQPNVAVSKFYIVLCKDEPKLWLAEVRSIVAAGRSVATKGRLLPEQLLGKSYWEHEGHSPTCGLYKDGAWGDVTFPMMCSSRCKASGTVNVRYYHPQLTAEEKEPGAALAWATKTTTSTNGDVGAPSQPTYITAHWVKKPRENEANEVLGNLGPEIMVGLSHGGKKIRLLVDSQKIYVATALQMVGANHPLYK